jgi:hypothetical protein
MVENWLERMPFFGEDFWRDWEEAPNEPDAGGYSPFWSRYRTLYEQSLSERDEKADLLGKFDDIFFKAGWGPFRPTALRAALFIMLYRDEPMFRLPFALLNSLIEIDEQLGNFRYRHLQMVRRMIGSRVAPVEAAASNTCRARSTVIISFASWPASSLSSSSAAISPRCHRACICAALCFIVVRRGHRRNYGSIQESQRLRYWTLWTMEGKIASQTYFR